MKRCVESCCNPAVLFQNCVMNPNCVVHRSAPEAHHCSSLQLQELNVRLPMEPRNKEKVTNSFFNPADSGESDVQLEAIGISCPSLVSEITGIQDPTAWCHCMSPHAKHPHVHASEMHLTETCSLPCFGSADHSWAAGTATTCSSIPAARFKLRHTAGSYHNALFCSQKLQGFFLLVLLHLQLQPLHSQTKTPAVRTQSLRQTFCL